MKLRFGLARVAGKVRLAFGQAMCHRLAGQLAAADGVVNPFAEKGVSKPTSVAGQQHVVAVQRQNLPAQRQAMAAQQGNRMLAQAGLLGQCCEVSVERHVP
jgi:hypothetical protein